MKLIAEFDYQSNDISGNNLREGELSLVFDIETIDRIKQESGYEVPKNVMKWRVRSGLKGFQQLTDIWTRGKGSIPPSDEIIGKYSVYTIPHYSSKSRSLFFPINPNFVTSKKDNSLVRSELGIHHDFNTPGSSGCIVFVNKYDFCNLIGFLSLIAHLDKPDQYVDLDVFQKA